MANEGHAWHTAPSRPPHGGWGLKFKITCAPTGLYVRPPPGGWELKYKWWRYLDEQYEIALRTEGGD